MVRAIPAAAIGVALLALGWRAGGVLAHAFAVLTFPLSLDYGEGIVIQQALMMTGPQAYGPITAPPFIVFHYPPVYHWLVRAGAALAGGADLVEAGRVVSLLAAFGIAAALAALATAAAPAGRWRWIAGLAASLVFLGAWSVDAWLPFARVDMLSLAFSMGGLAMAARSRGRRAMVLGAVLLFVLGVYTKQTSVAAPIAAVAVLLLSDPRRGVEAIVAGLAVSLLALGAAQWVTEGGFLRHVVAYNVNRFEIRWLLILVAPVLAHLPLLAAIALGLAGRSPEGGGILPGVRKDPHDNTLAMLVLHFALATAMLALIGKSGANLNYLLEWTCSIAALAGAAVGRAIGALRNDRVHFAAGRAGIVLMAAAIAIQPFLLPPAGYAVAALRREAPDVAPILIGAIRDAGRPVISDDMVALLRAGQEVPWEPAIFAELASLGRWDEALIVAQIHDGRLAFAVTEGLRGDRLFDSRYTPALADAMDAAWPRKVRLGHFVLHLPPDTPSPPLAIPLRALRQPLTPPP
jgi:hypothetical protein